MLYPLLYEISSTDQCFISIEIKPLFRFWECKNKGKTYPTKFLITLFKYLLKFNLSLYFYLLIINLQLPDCSLIFAALSLVYFTHAHCNTHI